MEQIAAIFYSTRIFREKEIHAIFTAFSHHIPHRETNGGRLFYRRPLKQRSLCTELYHHT